MSIVVIMVVAVAVAVVLGPLVAKPVDFVADADVAVVEYMNRDSTGMNMVRRLNCSRY
mgnify:CR=1 FL=1